MANEFGWMIDVEDIDFMENESLHYFDELVEPFEFGVLNKECLFLMTQIKNKAKIVNDIIHKCKNYIQIKKSVIEKLKPFYKTQMDVYQMSTFQNQLKLIDYYSLQITKCFNNISSLSHDIIEHVKHAKINF